jgi:hypothetical protein
MTKFCMLFRMNYTKVIIHMHKINIQNITDSSIKRNLYLYFFNDRVPRKLEKFTCFARKMLNVTFTDMNKLKRSKNPRNSNQSNPEFSRICKRRVAPLFEKKYNNMNI